MSTDLLYTDIEEQLRDSVRRLLSQRLTSAQISTAYDKQVDFGPLWTALATELDVSALLIPETHGGAGASMREMCVVAEELGRACAPVPFLTSSVVATAALVDSGESEMLEAVAAGRSTVATVIGFAERSLHSRVPVQRSDTGLVGAVPSVAGVEMADILLVPANGPDGLELHIVDSPGEGVGVLPAPSLDMSRPLSDVSFHNTPSRRIANQRSAVEIVNRALVAGGVALASEQLGVATWCFETTLRYVKERFQFGRAIGSFQAVKHRLADLWVEIGQAGAAARYAADVCARGDADLEVAVAVAQSFCSAVAVHAAEECVQLHGGIGMTWEHPAHLYLKRAKADESALGNPYDHRSRLAELVDLPPS